MYLNLAHNAPGLCQWIWENESIADAARWCATLNELLDPEKQKPRR
jgi:hypothetical protein